MGNFLHISNANQILYECAVGYFMKFCASCLYIHIVNICVQVLEPIK